MRRPVAALVLVLVLLAAGCSGGSDGDATPTTAPPGPGSTTGTGTPGETSAGAPGPPAGAPPKVRLDRVTAVSAGTAVALRSGDPAIYLTEQAGRVRAVRNGLLDPTPVLDLTDEVLAGGERGLLGLAFSADGGTLYAYWTAKQPVGQITIASFPMGATTADRSAPTVLLTIGHERFPNHNGGILQLGPDGFLYAGVGDGGSGGDPDGNGQNTGVLLGKVLRIDPTRPSGGRPYGIPPGNPFASGGGRPEVWAYGLRNPWRLSFDPPTGTVWIADVGQNQYEEVNRTPADRPGVNYGWVNREGLHAYKGGRLPDGAVDPVAELDHGDGFCSITGGFVYRGARIPGLVGRYVFADFCNDTLQVLTEGPRGWVRAELGAKAEGVRTFGLDHDGELLVLSTAGLSRLAPV